MTKQTIHHSAQNTTASPSAPSGAVKPSARAQAATIRSLVAQPATAQNITACLPELILALKDCAAYAGHGEPGAHFVDTAEPQLAILEAHRWLSAGPATAQKAALGATQTVQNTENSLKLGLRRALQEVLGAVDRAEAAPPPNQTPEEAATHLEALGHKLAQLGPIADALSGASSHFDAFTAANAAGHLVDKTLRRLAQTAPRLHDLYVYPYKSRDDFDRLDKQALPATRALPPMGFVLHKEAPAKAASSSGKTLAVSHGRAYQLSATLNDRTGMTGKVHLARSVETPEQKYIVKVQRTQDKIAGRQQTQSNPIETILRRGEEASVAESQLTSGLKRLHPRTLASVAQETMATTDGRVRVEDHFIDEFGKYYQLMPAMAGDLTDLTHDLARRAQASPEMQKTVAVARLSVAKQTFAQLAAMHRRTSQAPGGVAHRDLKLNNIVFDVTGGVRLIDFDESKKLSLMGHNKAPPDNAGSIGSPERFLPGRIPKNYGSAKASDIWCLGVALLAFATDDNSAAIDNPFMRQTYDTPHGAVTTEAYYLAYEAWWHAQVPRGQAVLSAMAPLGAQQQQDLAQQVQGALAKLEAQGDKIYPVTFRSNVDGTQALAYVADGFTQYINQQIALQPALASVVLRDALAPEPKNRRSAAAINKSLDSLLKTTTLSQQQEAAALFASAADASPLGA